MSDSFSFKNGLKQGDALPPLILDSILECAIGGFRQTRSA
jgi:hypothetical protein